MNIMHKAIIPRIIPKNITANSLENKPKEIPSIKRKSPDILIINPVVCFNLFRFLVVFLSEIDDLVLME
jgi:hypothetical protein